MKRIIVVGTTGSGKSTLCHALRAKLNYNYIQLDKIFWKANWQASSDQEFFPKIEKELSQSDHWILDGNYSRTMHISWPKADTVVWVDFPFWLVFYQSFLRASKRIITQEELWPNTGNRESFVRLLSKDSILRWVIRTYPRMKERYEAAIGSPENSHIKFHRLRSRKEVAAFLKTF